MAGATAPSMISSPSGDAEGSMSDKERGNAKRMQPTGPTPLAAFIDAGKLRLQVFNQTLVFADKPAVRSESYK